MEVTLVYDYQNAYNTISLLNLKPLLRIPAEMQKFLLLKQNQVYDKIASYQSVLPEKLFINMYAYM